MNGNCWWVSGKGPKMQPSGATDSVSVQITQKLANLTQSSEASIYKVHKQLRCINENAYEPEIVAIGPYHHDKDKPNLQMMEVHKLRYLQQLLQEKGEINADRYILTLRSRQLDTRRYYAESFSLTDDEFVEMLLLDGCFVIEVIRKWASVSFSNNCPIFQSNWMVNSLGRDLMLFENQLPFHILCELFDLIEGPGNHIRFVNLALCSFEDIFPGKGCRTEVDANSALNYKHLLELLHKNWMPNVQTESENVPNTMSWSFIASTIELLEKYVVKMKNLFGLIHDCLPSHVQTVNQNASNTRALSLSIPCASKLLKYGVKLGEAKEYGSLFDISYRSGVLQIPPLVITDNTEAFLRNLIAHEEYCAHSERKYMTDYTHFIDCLINSANDVDILCHYGIIDNLLGDAEVVSDIFNKIGNGVTFANYCYNDIFWKLNDHCSKRRNKWCGKLSTEYFDSPWGIISVLAAFLLLLLAGTQTFFTIAPKFGIK